MSAMRDRSDNTGWKAGSRSPQTLLDLCSESYSLIFHIHAGNDPGHPEDLRKNIAFLFQNLERHAARIGLAEEDIKATRYALCALIDETILNSRWGFKDQWADRPLQLEYFGEQLAGERFFDLLGRIRKKGRSKVDLLEVFCMCLILGFQGKYKLGGGEELAKLTQAMVDEVLSYRGATSGLAPHWMIPEEPVERPVQTIPRWAWITVAASVILVIVAFVVYRFLLYSAAADAVQRMNL